MEAILSKWWDFTHICYSHQRQGIHPTKVTIHNCPVSSQYLRFFKIPPLPPQGVPSKSPNHLYNTNDAISSLMSLIWHHLNISCPVGHQNKIHCIWHFPSILNLTPCHASKHFAIFLIQLSPRLQNCHSILSLADLAAWESMRRNYLRIHYSPKSQSIP